MLDPDMFSLHTYKLLITKLRTSRAVLKVVCQLTF